jgi:hypothetical protein
MEIKLLFRINSNNGITHILESPSKKALIKECDSLDTWEGYFISLTDGSVKTLRSFLLLELDKIA